MNPVKHVFSYLLYCKYVMFYFLRKLSVPHFNPPSPLWNQIFSDLPQQYFYENFLPRFWMMGCKCHDIANSAGSQTNNKSSKHDSMTACRILQKLLSKNQSERLQTWYQESIGKISNWVEIWNVMGYWSPLSKSNPSQS